MLIQQERPTSHMEGKHKPCMSPRKMGNINHACAKSHKELIWFWKKPSFFYNWSPLIKEKLSRQRGKVPINWLKKFLTAILLPRSSGEMTPCLLLVKFLCEAAGDDWERPAGNSQFARTQLFSTECQGIRLVRVQQNVATLSLLLL